MKRIIVCVRYTVYRFCNRSVVSDSLQKNIFISLLISGGSRKVSKEGRSTELPTNVLHTLTDRSVHVAFSSGQLSSIF